MKKIWSWTLVSVLAGIVLGVYLKAVQFVTGIKVYLLLLNIDYIPVLNRLNFWEMGEFILHLAASIIIGNVLQWGITKWRLVRKQQFLIIISASLIVAIAYYPVIILFEQTLGLLSIIAFTWWISGHLLYGFSLFYLQTIIAKN